jgi:hypothetical protein
MRSAGRPGLYSGSKIIPSANPSGVSHAASNPPGTLKNRAVFFNGSPALHSNIRINECGQGLFHKSRQAQLTQYLMFSKRCPGNRASFVGFHAMLNLSMNSVYNEIMREGLDQIFNVVRGELQ